MVEELDFTDYQSQLRQKRRSQRPLYLSHQNLIAWEIAAAMFCSHISGQGVWIEYREYLFLLDDARMSWVAGNGYDKPPLGHMSSTSVLFQVASTGDEMAKWLRCLHVWFLWWNDSNIWSKLILFFPRAFDRLSYSMEGSGQSEMSSIITSFPQRVYFRTVRKNANYL